MVTLGPLHVAEFKELLLALKLEIPDAKALRFFRICDKDNSGEIDFQEFQTVLYATDPGEAVVGEGGGWDSSSCESQLRHAAWMVVLSEGGNPTGYQPSSIVGPRDVFDMFDEDRSGEMDEDEFYYALDYLGIKARPTHHTTYYQHCRHCHHGSAGTRNIPAVSRSSQGWLGGGCTGVGPEAGEAVQPVRRGRERLHRLHRVQAVLATVRRREGQMIRPAPHRSSLCRLVACPASPPSGRAT